MQERKNSEAGNEKEVDYGRKSGQDNTSENVIENRPEKRVKNKGGNKTGEFIARKRKERGMTQKEMAELLGVTNKAVSKWETSQGMPDIGILPELGKALGVTVDEILMGEQIEQEKRAETAVSDEDKKLLEIVLERAERKAETIRITWKDVFGGSVKNFVALVKNGSFLVRITDMTILIEKEFIYGSSKRPNPTDYYRKQHYQCG